MSGLWRLLDSDMDRIIERAIRDGIHQCHGIASFALRAEPLWRPEHPRDEMGRLLQKAKKKGIVIFSNGEWRMYGDLVHALPGCHVYRTSEGALRATVVGQKNEQDNGTYVLVKEEP